MVLLRTEKLSFSYHQLHRSVLLGNTVLTVLCDYSVTILFDCI